MMKPLYAAFLFMLTLSLFSSCKKDELRSSDKDFIGTWELRKTYCGFCPGGSASASHSAGNGDIIVLGENGSYERKENDISKYKGTYTLELKADCGADKQKVTFITTSEYNSEDRIEINAEGLLVISTSRCVADGGSSYYERVD